MSKKKDNLSCDSCLFTKYKAVTDIKEVCHILHTNGDGKPNNYIVENGIMYKKVEE